MVKSVTQRECFKIRKILSNNFKQISVKVTSDKKSKGFGCISIEFSSAQIAYNTLLECLRDNGYGHFMPSSYLAKDNSVYDSKITGVISECNISLAVFV